MLYYLIYCYICCYHVYSFSINIENRAMKMEVSIVEDVSFSVEGSAVVEKYVALRQCVEALQLDNVWSLKPVLDVSINPIYT